MAYRDELGVARQHAERLENENRALRARLGGRARSRRGASLVMLFWTLAALSAGFLGLAGIPDDPDAPSALDLTPIADVVTAAPGPDPEGRDVRATTAAR